MTITRQSHQKPQLHDNCTKSRDHTTITSEATPTSEVHQKFQLPRFHQKPQSHKPQSYCNSDAGGRPHHGGAERLLRTAAREENTQQNTQQDTTQNTQQDTQQNTQQDAWQNTQQDTRKNTKQDTRQNTQQDSQQNTEKNTQRCGCLSSVSRRDPRATF